MTENECMDLIQKTVHESFVANTEAIEGSMCRMAENRYPSTMEGFASLCSAVLDYTINVSEITCVSVIKVLVQAGILDVRTPEKEDWMQIAYIDKYQELNTWGSYELPR